MTRPAIRWDARYAANFANELSDSLDNIETAVAKSYVDAVEDDPTTKAWGVWVQPPDESGGKREGQYGILGTSAGLELMVSSRDFRNDIASEDRRDLIIDSWRYLHSKLDDSGDYRRTLAVRQSQVLRCLSALDYHITALSRARPRDLSAKKNRKLAQQILKELKQCRCSDQPIAGFPYLEGLDGEMVTLYKFSSQGVGTDENKETLPKAPIEWAYLWGSVLVGLTRSFLAYFLSAEKFNQLVKPQELDQLASWATRASTKKDDPDELRVGLFVGWAILQLEELFEEEPDRCLADLHTGGTGTIVDDHRHHLEARPSRKRREALRKALRKGATSVIHNQALRGDLHHPYSFHIAVDGKKASDTFKQDHLVVPTLPVALWLKARLDSRALFDEDFVNCALDVAKAFDKVENKNWRGVAPAQSSTFNGTVNMNYIHEAVAEVHDLALRTKKKGAVWRFQSRFYRWWSRISRWMKSPKFGLIYATVLVLLGPLIAAGYVHFFRLGGSQDDGSAPSVRSRQNVPVKKSPPPHRQQLGEKKGKVHREE